MEVSVEPNPKIAARSPSESGSFLSIAVESLTAQAESLTAIASRLGKEFDSAVELILACQGRTIISGMGKSGLIAKKIAATFASTGTPSFFIHPAEAFHGDLDMITQYDLLVLISYSGETEEVSKLLPSLKHFGNRIISLSGHQNSTLAQHSDISLDIAVEREVCPNNLAPTTSTLATMAMGDALAVALIHAREFKPDDFAMYHPGGNLGRRLLTRVRDNMHKDNLPIVSPEQKLRDCLFTMTTGRLGLAIIVENNSLLGILTDGDLRRAMLQDPQTLDRPVRDFMTPKPITVASNTRLTQAEETMRKHKIKAMIVTRERGPGDGACGVLEIFD